MTDVSGLTLHQKSKEECLGLFKGDLNVRHMSHEFCQGLQMLNRAEKQSYVLRNFS